MPEIMEDMMVVNSVYSVEEARTFQILDVLVLQVLGVSDLRPTREVLKTYHSQYVPNVLFLMQN